jgi:hypothetical protein
MQNPNVFIELYPDMGRGMATFGGLQKGCFIMQCELLVLNASDTLILDVKTELKHYTFNFNDLQDCLCLGNGELFNHSDTPNVSYELKNFEQDGQIRKVMMFTATRDIEPGEQLFIDYTQDMLVDTDKYVTSKSLIGG